jgi:hypothetical protein
MTSELKAAEAIANKLTEAQRDKLLYGYFPMIGWANVSVNGRPTHIPELVSAGLLERSTDLSGAPHFCAYHATPLGLVVREYLMAADDTRPSVPDKQLTDVVERLKNSLTCKGARLNDGDWTTLQARDVRAIIDAMDAISRCGISASDQAASA